MPGPRVLLCSALFLALVRTPAARTFNYVIIGDQIRDGRDGKCPSINGAQAIGQICATRWRVLNRTSGPQIQMQLPGRGRCIYFVRNTIEHCLAQSASGLLQSEICVREQTYYYMDSICMGKWLKWESCTKQCGGGLARRYKFTQQSFKTKYYETESRACNTHACPQWSPWQPSRTVCDANCTRVWSRTCHNASGVVNASLCALGNAQQAVTWERRPCYVSECPNYAMVRPPSTAKSSTSSTLAAKSKSSTSPSTITKTTATTTTTTATTSTRNSKTTSPTSSTAGTTTTTQATSTSTQATSTKSTPKGRLIDPKRRFNFTRPVLAAPRDVAEAKTPTEDSKALVWIGVLVGLLAFCVLALLAYIGMQKYRKGKLSAHLFRSPYVPSSAPQGASANATGGVGSRSTNQYHSSSIDRLIARVRALQQMATLRRSSPSSVYLQPDVPPGPRRGDSVVSHRQQSNTPRARTVSFSENPVSYSSVPAAEPPEATGDPIYADIPAYRGSGSFDDFTSDSEQLDEPPTPPVPLPQEPKTRFPQRGSAGSFVARQDPGGIVRSQLRRCETERRGALHDDSRLLGGARQGQRTQQPKRSSLPNYMRHGMAPGSSGWNQAFGEFGGDQSYNKPLKRGSGMGSVAESSLENLPVLAASPSRIPSQKHHYADGEATVYLQPNRSTQADNAQAAASTSSNPTAQTYPAGPPEGFAGAYNASHEFGFHRTPSESRSARNSAASAQSGGESDAERDNYREPIDAMPPKVQEATYNVPFESRAPV